jgi:hypothetical protein
MFYLYHTTGEIYQTTNASLADPYRQMLIDKNIAYIECDPVDHPLMDLCVLDGKVVQRQDMSVTATLQGNVLNLDGVPDGASLSVDDNVLGAVEGTHASVELAAGDTYAIALKKLPFRDWSYSCTVPA